ncbi:MAG TPA: ABC transporter permease, partial [Vicinamibacterales bacterium]
MPVRLALQTLAANPLRTTLSTLGIVMGTASLAAVLSLGDGMEAFARQRIERQGLQVIQVSARTADRIDGLRVPRRQVVSLTPDDAAGLAAELDDSTGVMLTRRGVVRWRTGPEAAARAAVLVGISIHRTVPVLKLAAGRLLKAEDAMADRIPAVASAALARSLGATESAAAIGRDLAIDDHRFHIVGVLDGPVNGEPALHVPFEVATAIAGGTPAPEPPMLTVHATRVEDVPALRGRIEAWASRRFGDGLVVAATGAERLRNVTQGVLLFKILMGAFTAVALLVG